MPSTDSKAASTPSSWREWYGRRLAWARRARTDLVESLQVEEVRSIYETAPEHEATFVAVLGPSQVGKTTLLLRLLGLNPDGEAAVGRLLRGGRAAGESASATAAIYGPSGDEHFRYQEPDQTEVALDEGALLERLKDLRERVEKGTFGSTDAVLIRLPRSCFREGAPSDLHVIDLPGFGGRDRAEQAHAARLFERFLPLAPLALLVERADNLSSLGYLTVPGIGEGWLHFPERYAIVLTRALSAASVQEQVRGGTLASYDQVVGYYRAEVSRSLAATARSGGRWDAATLNDRVDALGLYPVDLGQSLETLPDDVRAAAEPVVDEALETLDGRVRQAVAPAGVLATTAGLWKAARTVREGAVWAFERDDEEREDEIERTETALVNLHLRWQHLEVEQAAAEERLLDAAAVVRRVVPPFGVKEGPETGRVPTYTAFLNGHAKECRKQARKARALVERELPFELADDLPRRAVNLYESKVQGARKKLKGYHLDAYWRKKLARKDGSLVEEKARKGVKAARDLLVQEVREAAKATREAAEHELRRIAAHKESLALQAKEEGERLERLEREREERREEHERRLAQLDRDVKTGKDFHAFLAGRYQEETQAHRDRLACPSLSDGERFFALANLYLITHEYERLTARTLVAS